MVHTKIFYPCKGKRLTRNFHSLWGVNGYRNSHLTVKKITQFKKVLKCKCIKLKFKHNDFIIQWLFPLIWINLFFLKICGMTHILFEIYAVGTVSLYTVSTKFLTKKAADD